MKVSIGGEGLIASVSVTVGGNTLIWNSGQMTIGDSSWPIQSGPYLSAEVRHVVMNVPPLEVKELPTLEAYRIRRVMLAQEEWLKEAVPVIEQAGYVLEDLALAHFYVEGAVALVPKECQSLPFSSVQGQWPLFDGIGYLVSPLNAHWRAFARFDVLGAESAFQEVIRSRANARDTFR